jgi:hypothetical protein
LVLVWRVLGRGWWIGRRVSRCRRPGCPTGAADRRFGCNLGAAAGAVHDDVISVTLVLHLLPLLPIHKWYKKRGALRERCSGRGSTLAVVFVAMK